jgi:Na+/phosphate symporter
VQNLLAETRSLHSNNTRDKLIELDLDVQMVSDIVTALSQVAEHAAGSKEHSKEHSKEEMIAIHQTLLDWLLYAQSFLETINPLAVGKNDGEKND